MFRVAVIIVLASGGLAHAQQAIQEPALPPAAQQPAPDLAGFANETEKGSYALGYSFGQTIQARRIEYEAESLLAGMRDALTGAKARLSAEDITLLARAVQNAGARRLQAERADLAAKNQAEGNAFLEANKKRAGVVALPSGLQYEMLQPGSGPKPAVDDTVKVQFRGTLLDGTVVDSSYDRGAPIVVRPDQVIKAWAEALPFIPVGSKFKVYAPSSLAYGDKGGAANVPPGATIIFEMELLSIEKKAEEQKAPGT
jgi:FKBP-type peptidyl-prolyl cis-trans isomerase FklB